MHDVESQDLPSAVVPADPADEIDQTPAQLDELPTADSEVVEPSGSWVDVEGLPLMVRATDEPTVLGSTPSAPVPDDDATPDSDSPDPSTGNALDLPPMEISVLESPDPASAAVLISVEPTTDGSAAEEPTEEPTSAATNPAVFRAGDPVEESGGAGVEVQVSYADFDTAFGAGWADRLQVTAYPACFAATPEDPACAAGQVIASSNDGAAQTLTFATVEIDTSLAVDEELPSETPSESASPESTDPEPSISPAVFVASAAARGTTSAGQVASLPAGSGTVYAVAGGTSGSGGNFAATPLPLAGNWQVGEGSGLFSYSYPFTLPGAQGGGTPGLSLRYSSATVDGMSVAENGQAGMFGLGWDFSPGHISRRYAPCSQDGQTTRGDLCWKTKDGALVEELSITLNGTAEPLVAVSANEFRLRHDPGWKVERVTGMANTDDNGEAFKVRTPDGSIYWFGYGGGTASTFTVPVFGNNSGEPCYNAATSTAYCQQGWQWGLDRVLDANGNKMVYNYSRETGYYGRWANSANQQAYDRGGWLTSVEYGFAQPTGTVPHQEVNLYVAPRCVQRITDPANACPTFADHPEDYPDIPADLICSSSAPCDNFSPSFFSTRIYEQMVTRTRKGISTSTASWDVSTYDFHYTMPDPDGTGSDSPDLFLSSVQRTGHDDDGSMDNTPAVKFDGIVLQNRVDPDTGQRALKKFRVDSVRNERGGRVNVTYGHAESRACDVAYVTGRSRDDSLRECFSQKYTPPGGTPRFVWFHKYVVTRLELADDALGISSGGSTTTAYLGKLRRFEYEYEGAPAWRYGGSRNVADDTESWTDWRGYETTVIHTKRIGANQVPQTDDVAKRRVTLYRGMHSSRKDIAGTIASVKLNTTEFSDDNLEPQDFDWLSGRVAEEKTYDDNSNIAFRTYHEYVGWTSADVSTGPDAVVAAESRTSSYTRVTDTAGAGVPPDREHRVYYTVDDGGTNHRGLLAGVVTAVADQGLTTVSTDSICTTTTWWANSDPDQWIRAPRETNTFGDNCADTGSASPVSRSAVYYDAMTPGTATASQLVSGNATTVRTWTSNSGAVVDTRASYDTYGRPWQQWDGKNQLVSTTAFNPNGGNPDDLLQEVWVTDAKGWVSKATLGSRTQKPSTLIDVNGYSTTLGYDGLGRTTAVFLPGRPAGTTSITYTYQDLAAAPSRVLASVLREKPGTTEVRDATYTYHDGWGRAVETQTMAANDATDRVVSATVYDERGKPSVSIPAMGNTDPLGTGLVINANPTEVDHYTKTSYDYAGRPTVVSDMNQTGLNYSTTTNYYGDATRTRVTGLPTGVPNPAGDTWTKYGARNPSQIIQYANAGNTIDTQADYTWTPTGLLDKISTTVTGASTPIVYDYNYDLAGRRTSAQDPDTGQTTYAYDANSNLTDVDDAMPNDTTSAGTSGGVVHTDYDVLNRPTARTRKLTVSGVLTPQTPPLAEWGYDTPSKGRLAWSKSYSALGNLTTTVTGYDARGRAQGVTYDYPASLVGSAANAVGPKTETYTYNQVALTATTLPAAGGLSATTLNMTHGNGGALSTVTTGTGTGAGMRTLASVAYDGLNRPVSVLSTGLAGESGLARIFAYESTTGRLDTLTAKAGLAASTEDYQLDYDYDVIGQPRRITATSDAGQEGAWCYTYDGLRRLATARTATKGAAPGTCGAADAVSDAVTGARYDLAYTYDSTRLKTVTNTGVTTATATYAYTAATHPHAPTATTLTGTAAPSLPTVGQLGYDAAGRAIDWAPTGGAAVKSTYDTSGNLTKTGPVTPGATDTVIENAYDADGIRWARKDTKGTTTTTTVLYLGATEITHTATGQTNATTALRRYTGGDGTPLAVEEQGSGWTWLFGDNQSSVRLTKTVTGGILGFHNYYPYGKPVQASALPAGRGYLDKPLDPNGEIRLDHRSYDPGFNQLTTPDPLLIPGDPQSLNPYAYARNNPGSLSDPSGLAPYKNGEQVLGNTGGTCYSNCGAPDDGPDHDPNYEPNYEPPPVDNSGGGDGVDRGGCLPVVGCNPIKAAKNLIMGTGMGLAVSSTNAQAGGYADEMAAWADPRIRHGLEDGTNFLLFVLSFAAGPEVGAARVTGGGIFRRMLAGLARSEAPATARAAALTEREIGGVIDDILRGASFDKQRKVTQYVKPGGFGQANADFDALAQGVHVIPRGGGLRTATLSNGTKIGVRPFSSGKYPTLEIDTPGNLVLKIRY